MVLTYGKNPDLTWDEQEKLRKDKAELKEKLRKEKADKNEKLRKAKADRKEKLLKEKEPQREEEAAKRAEEVKRRNGTTYTCFDGFVEYILVVKGNTIVKMTIREDRVPDRVRENPDTVEYKGGTHFEHKYSGTLPNCFRGSI